MLVYKKILPTIYLRVPVSKYRLGDQGITTQVGLNENYESPALR